MLQASDPKIDQIVSWLKEKYQPLRLFFYGSRANGTHREDSDYDFVMVLPEFDSKNRLDEMMNITSQVRKALGIEAHVWIYSKADFEDWKDEFSSIPETAMNTGREIELG